MSVSLSLSLSLLPDHSSAVLVASVGDHVQVRSPELKLSLPVDDCRQWGTHQERALTVTLWRNQSVVCLKHKSYRPCVTGVMIRAPDKMRIFISKMAIFSPKPMFDHLLESSYRDDSIKWSNIGFGEEITNKSRLKFIL